VTTSVRHRRLSAKDRFSLKLIDAEGHPFWLCRWPGASPESEKTGDWTGMPERALLHKWAAAKNIQRLLALHGETVVLELERVDDGESP
jgi:hypothetical protein